MDNIAICLVTFNSGLFVEKCIRSIPEAADKLHVSIFITDNNSNDDTLTILNRIKNNSNIPITIISSKKNLGYAGGNNLAIKAVIDSGISFNSILILNPDIRLTDRSISDAHSLLLSKKNIGGVSPNLSIKMSIKDHKSIFGFKSEEIFPGIISVDRLHGGFMLLSFDVVNKVGFIDENYFHYWEEIDYSLRIKNLGYELIQDFNLKMYHDGDSYTGVFKPYRIYYLYRNQFYFARKNFSGGIRVKFLLRRFLSNIRDFIFFLKMRRFDLLMAGFAGICDGIIGKVGKSESKYANYVH